MGPFVEERLHMAEPAQLEHWADRVLFAESLEQVFSNHCARSAPALKAPKICLEHARLLPQVIEALQMPANATPAARSVLDIIERTDGLRRPERLTSLLQAAACAPHLVAVHLPDWQHWLQCVVSLDSGAIARQATPQTAQGIQATLRKARLDVLLEVMDQSSG